MTQPDTFDLFAEEGAGSTDADTQADPTVPVVELTDTDLGVVATITWPHLRGTQHVTPGGDPYAEAWPDRAYAIRLADIIREHCPTVEVWWPSGCEYLAIRQGSRDVVARPGDTLVIVASEVSRASTTPTRTTPEEI